jgi:hypothetical protein
VREKNSEVRSRESECPNAPLMATVDVYGYGKGQAGIVVVARHENLRGAPIYGRADRVPDAVRFLGLTVGLPRNAQGHSDQIVIMTDYDVEHRNGQIVTVPKDGRVEIYAEAEC